MAGTVLVVDDDPKMREAVQLALIDFTVKGVGNGAAALSILNKPNDIQLIVLDIMMPSGMSGIEVLTQIKRLNPLLQVLILTGYGTKDMVLHALRAHADDFLEKPFDAVELRSRVAQLFEKQRAAFTHTASEEDMVKRAMWLIEKNFNKHISLEDIAAMTHLSPKYFSRVFHEKTGKKFTEFRTGVKVNGGKHLLEKSNYDVNQIAEYLGYDNPGSFMKAFKKVTGLTPTEYRKHHVMQPSFANTFNPLT